MKHVFLDTNVIIDFLGNRKPFSEYAAEIFNLAEENKIKIYVSAVSYNNIYYILRHSLSHKESLNLLNILSGMTEVVTVNNNIILKALQSDFKDFEDAIQYFCGLSISKIELIITRDSKDFRKSTLPVMNPQEACSFLKGWEMGR